MKTNPQGTAQWFSDRLGKVTASKVWTLCARQKNGNYYAAREDYKTEIILERLTGKVQEHYVSDVMTSPLLYSGCSCTALYMP
ncbi:MAG: hypothetical protein AAFY12_11665 [Pseudomonadota bacterium]